MIIDMVENHGQSHEDGRGRIEVRLEDNPVWLTQRLMAELFQTTVANVNIHLKSIFAEGEADEGSAIVGNRRSGEAVFDSLSRGPPFRRFLTLALSCATTYL
jgi:hypothetical protein